jgi:hypothetical protein
VSLKHLVAALFFLGVHVAAAPLAVAAEKEETAATALDGRIARLTPSADYSPAVARPALLPALYASLGAMQAWDIYSTQAALRAGAREANPTMAPVAGHAGAMLAMKAATTAGTIVFAERLWKKNKVGAIVMLVAVNGATAAVSMHNMRNARTSVARR